MCTISQYRVLISQNLKQHAISIDDDRWWLLGTEGCHLCDKAEELLRLFSLVQPITYEKIDISNFDEALMQQFATTIPVILTPTQQLIYPFSIMDLQKL